MKLLLLIVLCGTVAWGLWKRFGSQEETPRDTKGGSTPREPGESRSGTERPE